MAGKDGIYKRGKSWYVRVRVNGEQLRKSFGANKAAAEATLGELKKQRALGKITAAWSGVETFVESPKEGKKFAEAAQDYMDGRANYKRSSIISYKTILNHYLLPEFGTLALAEITDLQIRKFQAKISTNISSARVNTIMQLLRSILEEEYRQGIIPRNPSMAVRRMQESKTDVNPLSEEDLELALVNIDPHYSLPAAFQSIGIYWSKSHIALRWSDIDWKNQYIRITKGRVRGEEALPKTRSAERKIPMTPKVVQALNQEKGLDIKSIGDYIFLDKKGKPINKHLDRIWSRALRKAGLSHRPSYQLRHTFATQCIIKGLPLPYIAKVLGHSTIDTLIRHYASWIDEATAEHEEKLKIAFSINSHGKSLINDAS